MDHALSTVNLLSAADKLSKEYSGGMKRRLSVAISIIGGPRVVYLDEPSTGLDPAARRQLWDAVKGAKEGKAVVLTTHSMQEAEVLCDRLGIFVNGELFTIGTPQEVIDRYGGYMTLSISTPAADQDAAKALVASISSAAQIVYEVAGTVRARLPGSVRLSTVYQRIEAAISRGLRVEDWALHHASLEVRATWADGPAGVLTVGHAVLLDCL